MLDTLLPFIPLIAVFILLVFAIWVARKSPGGSNHIGPMAMFVGLAGLVSAVLSFIVVWNTGTLHTPLLGTEGLGFSLRLDTLSMTMFTMIALLGFVILKFSNNYLDGDARKGIFFRRLAVTVVSVELLVLSGNLFQLLTFWIITSICLHYLLTFYKSRPQAIGAARKKFIVARIGDFSLLMATALIYRELGTGELVVIFDRISEMATLSTTLIGATIFMVIAAVLKSAQFPTHGWLIEVVETPTPVSALLHAGLLNAGPFLMVRMGFLMIESTPASIMLIIIGGFTALFASVVYLTQPTIKIALGYSSVAHMGFSLLICGFGVHTAAILHVVAHSFYKALSFLSSGSVIDAVRARRISLPKRQGSFIRIVLSIAFAMGVYTLACFMWGISPDENYNLMIIGAIIVMGISQVIVATLDTKGNFEAILASMGIGLIVALSFFTLENQAGLLLATQLPIEQEPALIIKMAATAVILIYALVVLTQLMAPRLKRNTITYQLGVHLRNGLYVNVLFDRMIGSLKNEKFKWINLTVQEEQDNLRDYSKEINKAPTVNQ